MGLETSQMVASGQPTIPQDAPKTEVTPAAGAVAGTPDPKLDQVTQRLEQLTRKEVELSKRDRAVKALEVDIKKGQDEIKAWKGLKESARTKKGAEALAKEVWGESWYDHLTQMVTDGTTPQEWAQMMIDEKIGALKTETETARQQAEERQQQEQAQKAEQAIQNFKGEITAALTVAGADGKPVATPGAELASMLGATELIYQTVDSFYAKTGKVMDIKEAVELTEKHLMGELEKALSIPKIKARFQELIAGEKKEEHGTSEWKEFKPGLTSAVGQTTASTAPVVAFKNGDDRQKRGEDILDRLMAGRK